MSQIIGIDLGTTNSVVAVMEGGSPKVITNQEGSRTTPSVVGFGEAEGADVLVGQVARRQAITNPENTVYSIKRFMGHRFSEVASEQDLVPYELVEADNGDAAVKIRNRRYSPPEIAAKVLAKLRQAAEKYLGHDVTEAVVTVPAYFNDAQRSATRDAAVIAGLNVRRLVNEPTAAALAYNFDNKEDKLVAIYDFGGGTFDISILEIGEKVVEVRSTAGDTLLGGDNIDQLVIDYLIREFKNDTDIDVSEDRMVLQRLKEAAEKAKIELSSTLETDINLPFITADASGPKHLNIRMSRAKLEHLIGDLVEKTLVPCKQAIDDAGLRVSEIEEVILVGGSTRIPLVMQKVEEFFGHPPAHRVNPDEVVALGAAVQGAVLSGEIKDMLLLDVTPLSLGVETRGGVMAKLIERNTTIPVKRAKTFTTAVDNQAEVEIHVFQGERDFVKDNRSLGKFTLTDIKSAPRATPKIEVAFDIDANGIVNVSAVEKSTGRKQEITVTPSGGLAEGEIRRLLEEAEKMAEADKERRKTVEARNRLDGMIHSARRKASDLGGDGKFEEEVRTLRTEIGRAEDLVKSSESDLEALNNVFDAIGVALAALETASAAAENAAAEAEAKAKEAEGDDEEPDGDGEGDEADDEEVDPEAEAAETETEPIDADDVEDAQVVDE